MQTCVGEVGSRNIGAVVTQMMCSSRSQTNVASDANAIVTYLGQMIAHDIVKATNPREFDRLANQISPTLNLDSIYGKEDDTAELTEKGILKTDGYFNIIPKTDTTYTKTVGYDFPRTDDTIFGNAARVARTMEIRNDENIIIAQLTLSWMRLHNKLLEFGYATNFNEAKRLVVTIFQIICVELVCASLFSKKVFNHYFRSTMPPSILINVTNAVPDFFSLATFRFGHSMVRDKYVISRGAKPPKPFKTSVDTKDIFQKHTDLKNSHYIDFALFVRENRAFGIDTRLIKAMGQIGQSTAHKTNIVQRNVIASTGLAELRDGQQFHLDKISEFAHTDNQDLFGEVLSPAQIQASFPYYANKQVPLWVYILIEAEKTQGSRRLGGLASTLNCAVIFNAIQSTYTSVVSNEGYKPNEAIGACGAFAEELTRGAPGLNDSQYGLYLFNNIIRFINS